MKKTMMKILILGDHTVGKSAVTVRFLTKRFIGEYYSRVDHVYRSTIRLEEIHTDIEVFDSCSEGASGVEEKQVQWADALVVVYSICNRQSFHNAKQLLTDLPAPAYLPLLLLGNKRDLEHRREVRWEEGDEVALEHGCQYYEVSAADSALSVNLAFQGLLREVRSVQQRRATLLKRRRGSLGSVGKMLGAMFGKATSGGGIGSKDYHGERRTSFSGGGKDFHGERRLSNGSKDSLSERRLSGGGGGGGGKDSSHRERKISPSNNGKDIVRERKISPSNGGKDSQRDRLVVSLTVPSKDKHRERSVSPSPTCETIPEKEQITPPPERKISPSSPGKESGHPDWTLAVSLASIDGHSDGRVALASGGTDGHRTVS